MTLSHESFPAPRQPAAPADPAAAEPRQPGPPDKDAFAGVTFDPERFRTDMRLTGARKSYAIFFTPRSGSSWLIEAVAATHRLGKPQEWFNPNFVPRIAQTINANNTVNYIKMLKRKQAPGGVFGFEITYYQMAATFGGEAAYLSHFPAATPSLFLVREHIVLQAVSLAKSIASSVFHAADASPEALAQADHDYAYAPGEIEHSLAHILDQELRLERFFAANRMVPLRLSYELMMAMGREALIRLIAGHLDETVEDTGTPAKHHAKLGTSRNAEFADRFARENPRFMRAVARRRERTLSLMGCSVGIPFYRTATFR